MLASLGAELPADHDARLADPRATVERLLRDRHPAVRLVAIDAAARKMAEESGVDTRDIPGTGRGGRITKGDVLLHMERFGAAAAPPPAPSRS